MRAECIRILHIVVLVSSSALAQWVKTSEPHEFGYGGAFAVTGTNIFAGTFTSGVFRSNDSGASWTAANAGMTYTTVSSFAVSGSSLFAGTYGGLFRSTDSGTSWTAADTGFPSYTTIYSLAVSGSSLFAGTSNGLFQSTDNGGHWTLVYGVPGVLSVAASGSILVFSADVTGTFRSTDGGTSWHWLGRGWLRGAYSLLISSTGVFVGTAGDGIFLFDGSDTIGTAMNTGLDCGYVHDFAVSGTNLFVATGGGGVYLSTNRGTNWTEVDAGLTDVYVRAVAVLGPYLFAGAEGSGVWRRALSEMITSVEPATEKPPRKFTLQQNYPNPFNPSTTIRYELPKSSMLRLSVYDILGREVSVLVNERKNAGSYEVKFDGTRLASGVYFYQLQAGDFLAVKKMLVVK